MHNLVLLNMLHALFGEVFGQIKESCRECREVHRGCRIKRVVAGKLEENAGIK
jgi:hypothetical protein